jgi:hypothetical protein
MKKKVGLILIVFLVLISILGFSVRGYFSQENHCGISFEDTIYEFTDSSGNSIFVIDEAGNLYINSSDISLNENNGEDPSDGMSLKYGNDWYWTFSNTLAQVKGEISEGATLPETIGSDMIMFRNPVNSEPLVLFNTITGNIMVKGRAVYYNSQADCADDDYYLNSGTKFWKDNYCEHSTCISRNLDLDNNETLCLNNGSVWAIDGDFPTDCCGDDTLNEFVISKECENSEGNCVDDSSDDACCNADTKCVQDSTCFEGNSYTCANWNSSIQVRCISANRWALNEDCTKKCKPNNCSTYSGCTGDDCDGQSNCAINETCDDGTGCVDAPQYCNIERTCSTPGDDGYNAGGNYSCEATCDGEGNCDYAGSCIDCSEDDGNGACRCTCGIYGEEESEANENCGDTKDNDCDGDTDTADSDCISCDGCTQEYSCNYNTFVKYLKWTCPDTRCSTHGVLINSWSDSTDCGYVEPVECGCDCSWGEIGCNDDGEWCYQQECEGDENCNPGECTAAPDPSCSPSVQCD